MPLTLLAEFEQQPPPTPVLRAHHLTPQTDQRFLQTRAELGDLLVRQPGIQDQQHVVCPQPASPPSSLRQQPPERARKRLRIPAAYGRAQADRPSDRPAGVNGARRRSTVNGQDREREPTVPASGYIPGSRRVESDAGREVGTPSRPGSRARSRRRAASAASPPSSRPRECP